MGARRSLAWCFVLLLSTPGVGRAEVRTWTHREPIPVSADAISRGTMLIPTPGVDAAITHMSVDVVDAGGDPISGVMLHHIVFLNFGSGLGKRDATCAAFRAKGAWFPAPAWAERFFARGAESSTLEFPDGAGYRLERGDRWGALYMLMRYDPASVEPAWLQYTVTYRTGADAAKVEYARLLWMDVRNCEVDPVYSIAGGGSASAPDVRSMEFTLPESGRLVSGMGHLHGGGLRLELHEPDCGDREVWRSVPTWGADDHAPLRMSGFAASPGIPVAKGQRLRLDSLYDALAPHADVMGILGLMFVPDSRVTPEAACEAAPLLEILPADAR